MTENCGTCCVNYADDRNAAGTVGTCQPVVEIKLIDVPEMGYTSEDKPYPRGELLSRGANHFQGYYKGVFFCVLFMWALACGLWHV